MKSTSLFAAAFAWALAAGLPSVQAQNQVNTEDSWAVSASVSVAYDQPSQLPQGDRAESTAMLAYLAAFKDFPDSETNSHFFGGLLNFLSADGENGFNTHSSRILTSEEAPLENLDSTEIFEYVFRSFDVRDRDHIGTSYAVRELDSSNGNSLGGLVRDKDSNPLFGFVGRAMQMSGSYDDSDLKLKDARYTLD